MEIKKSEKKTYKLDFDTKIPCDNCEVDREKCLELLLKTDKRWFCSEVRSYINDKKGGDC